MCIRDSAIHTGCPVVRGTKWTATVWVHATPYRWTPPPEPRRPPGCDDADERCQKMAKDLAELDELMARGPGEARIREAARSMLRELEARYDNKMFDK